VKILLGAIATPLGAISVAALLGALIVFMMPHTRLGDVATVAMVGPAVIAIYLTLLRWLAPQTFQAMLGQFGGVLSRFKGLIVKTDVTQAAVTK
jgi:hypothetical protein